METDLPTPDQSEESILHTYAPGAIVKLINGDARSADADVVSLHPATIRITDRRVSALVDDKDWSWFFDDLEDAAHGADGTWTILPVPGVPDHGVAPRLADVTAFRRELERARHAAMHFTAPPVDEHIPVEPVREEPPVLDLAAAVVEATHTVPLPATEVRVGPTSAEGLATLEARSISAWFGDHHVLDRVSLTMQAGQVTALIGPSGCGKSTFLRILNRMHEMIPSASLAGEVFLDGGDVYDISKKLTDARRQIGMVFQKPNPFPAMSIYDNVVAGFRLTGTKINNSEKDDVVETCLTKAGLWLEVRDRLRQPGGGLSGGQQQRLCIARSLAIRPRVLLMDEPCSALDPTSTRRIEQTIVELKSEVTIVIVTHNMQQANRVSDQCAFFLAEAGTPGVIVEHGDTDAMFHNPLDERTHAYVNGRFG